MEKIQSCLITACINRNLVAGKDITLLLKECGIHEFNLVSSRNAFLQERSGFLGHLLPGRAMVSHLSDVISFLVDPAETLAAMAVLAREFNLTLPGNGSVFSETISIIGNNDLFTHNHPIPIPNGTTLPAFQNELTAICCIVQRGEGEPIARTVLQSGIGSPITAFGAGTGLRDKVGLLRITIPAEKEILLLLTDNYEAEQAFNVLIDAGKLDQPGKGFIYLYPIGQGLIDPKVSEGVSLHAASIDQIIFALDEVKGGTQWRRKDIHAQGAGRDERKCLLNLLDLTFQCNEGRADDLVAAAMAAGAAGATLSRLKYVGEGSLKAGKASPAREMGSMIIGEQQVDGIAQALEKTGLFDAQTQGQIRIKKVTKACTYLGKAS